uniref:Uncharacterized protein n=1 Tax=Candidatus Methanogaster sp. ANME-2c ERB4 TaxID=2759911 RepID=A0A7G9YH08_9EURY|nr:hypothetical protein POPKKDDM_00011 [Methanosarcinales archaeon ANME-2c ERB4]
MKNKILLLSVAVVAIGLFALPSALSMFAGQHSWYDPTDSGGIPCAKCHFLEKEELAASGGPHSVAYTSLVNKSMDYGSGPGAGGGNTFWGGTDSVDSRCYGCHQRAGSASSHEFLNGSWDDHRDDQHAAIAVWCIDCHPWVVDELSDGKAAHRWFYDGLNATTEPGTDDLALQQPNRACLGCHTHVGVNITWQRNAYVSYDVTCDALSGTVGGYGVTWNTSDALGVNASRFSSTSGYT